MADPSRPELPHDWGSRERPSELLRTYVSDPRSPRPDEVDRLVSELEVDQIELEDQNQELREAHEQLQLQEEDLRQSRAFLQTVIDAMPDAMLVIGRDYRIVLANRAARKLAPGIDPVACLTCHQLSHHSDVPCGGLNEPCPLATVIATKAPVTVVHTHYDAEGRELFVEVNAAPVFDVCGEVTHIIEDCRDITARKRMEKQRARLNVLKEQLLGPIALAEKQKLITDAVVEAFGADFARIWLLAEGDLCEHGCCHAAVTEGPDVCRDRSRCLHLVASSGRYTAIDGSHRRVPLGCDDKLGRIVAGEEPKLLSNDATHDPHIRDCQWAASLGLNSFAGYRLLAPEGAPWASWPSSASGRSMPTKTPCWRTSPTLDRR